MTPSQAALANPAPKANRKMRRMARKKARHSTAAVPELVTDNTVSPLRAALEQAKQLIKAKEYENCEQLLLPLANQYPEDGNIWLLLGLSHEFRTSHDVAYHCYKKSLDLAPNNPDTWLYLGRLLFEQNFPQASELAILKSLEIRPNFAEAYKILSAVRLDLGDAKGGMEACDAVLALQPDWDKAHYVRGLHLKAAGEMDKAREAFQEGLKREPKSIGLLHAITDISKGEQLEEVLDLLEAIDPDKIEDPKTRSDYYFVAGRVRRGLERHEEAFEFYARANDLQKEQYPFDAAAHREMIDELISVFTPEVLSPRRATGRATTRPIFIVGMPRSGSTLMERIITSHSAVHGAGESGALIDIVDALRDAVDTDLSYPRDVGKMDSHALGLLADQYLAMVERECPEDVPHFTDKMLFNYLHLGLIALMFPNAKVIHCRRNPLDICTSCYFVKFSNVQKLPFTADLEALGIYYREYDRLMAHWREVLPIPMLEVTYEELIEDQEAESRRIVEFLGLDWEEECLNFYKQEKSVRTASWVQVRQPIYKTSAGRWKLYEKQLAPLREALGDLVPDNA